MAENLPKPESRKESFLAKAAGENVELPTPASREELFLKAIADNGGGGGGTTYTAGDGIDITNSTISVDTTTIQPKLTAGSNVTISDNTISATDTTYSNFTGTDGNTGGTAGLVPAPATTDAGKFLKADGTWDTAGGGGGIVTLTSADYNYPVNNPTYVAAWMLAPGIYRVGEDSLNISYSTVSYISQYKGYEFEVEPAGDDVLITYYNPYLTVQKTKVSNGYNRGTYGIIDNLTSGSSITTSSSPLSAKQGAILKTLIDSLIQAGVSAPTTSTVGVLGQLYTDTTNMHTYQCTAISGDTYTWTQRW